MMTYDCRLKIHTSVGGCVCIETNFSAGPVVVGHSKLMIENLLKINENVLESGYLISH